MRRLMLLVLMFCCAGCSTYAAHRYTISADNVVALPSLHGTPLAVGAFTSTPPDVREIMCRGVGPIKTPDGETYADFIRKALIDELKIANAYAPTAPITLTGNVNHIDFSSFSGTWELALSVQSSNGRAMTVTESYNYTSSFYGETACNQTAQALMPAVQNLIGKVVRSPEFAGLVDQRAAMERPPLTPHEPVVSAPLPPPSVASPSVAYANIPPLAPTSVVHLQPRYITERLLLQPHPDAEPLSVIAVHGPLRVLAQRDAWLFIETPDGRRGWILRAWIAE